MKKKAIGSNDRISSTSPTSITNNHKQGMSMVAKKSKSKRPTMVDVTPQCMTYRNRHVQILKKGVRAWNAWRAENPNIRPHVITGRVFDELLTGVDLRNINLTDTIISANVSMSDLRGANLSHATLIFSEMIGADLEGADLSHANLHGASMEGANLRRASLLRADLTNVGLDEADLRGANLGGADFTDSSLVDANFGKAIMYDTIFGTNDLSSAIGLETVEHRGPSVIGIEAVYFSKGNIPEIFLRGAGVPDNFVIYMASLTGKAFEFYSCFISYSSKNQQFANRLYSDLQSSGVRCWLATEDLKIGDKTRSALDESIRRHEKLLLVLSKHSVNSDWVEQEVETALARERKERRLILFPIRLDDAVTGVDSGWPAFVKNTRNIGDFRKWKDYGEYRKAFARLVRDLRAGGQQANN